jgi:tetratricopeptide (TPR) repeat protein
MKDPHDRDSQGMIDEVRQRLEQLQATVGTAHPDSLAAMRELSDAYVSLGKFCEARDILASLLDIKKASDGDLSDYRSISNAYQLGYVLYQLGDLPWARKVQEQVLDFCIEMYGLDSVNAVRSLFNLDQTLIAQGDKERFVVVSRPVIEAQIDCSDPPSEDAVEFIYCLAQLHRSNGYPDVASKLYKRVMRGCVSGRFKPGLLIKAFSCETVFVPSGLLALKINPEVVRSHGRGR